MGGMGHLALMRTILETVDWPLEAEGQEAVLTQGVKTQLGCTGHSKNGLMGTDVLALSVEMRSKAFTLVASHCAWFPFISLQP